MFSQARRPIRQTEGTDPLSHTSYTYYSSVGTITKRTDAEGNDTLYEYDDAYRMVKFTDAEGNETKYQFDKNGNVTKIIDGRDKEFVTYQYNGLNKVTKQTDALGRYSEFTYDAVGSLSTKKDPLGNTTTLTYDAVNRLVKKQYQDSSWVGYDYDAGGNMVEASDGTLTFEFTYDAENKPTKVRDDTVGLEVEYAYDANGNLLWIEDTSNSKINYYYDVLNRVTEITNGSTFATIEYATCCSVRRKLTLGNGCYVEYDHDDAKRLTKITNKKSNGTVISSWEYGYDDVGNVTISTDATNKATQYTYDDIYQLTGVNYPSGSDYGYEYDAVGNRTKMFEYTTSTITTTYTYDNADELTQYTTSTLTMTFTYASDGCLKTKSDGVDTWTNDWDYERRLTGFKKNSATLVEYGYNPTGTRRYSSDSTLGLTNYFYSFNHTLGEYSAAWALEKSYVPGPKVDEVLAMVDRRYDPNITYYLTEDRLGSTRELVGSSDTVYTQYAYDAWGAVTETQLSGSISSRFLFNGWSYAGNEGAYTGDGIWYSPEYGRLLGKAPAGGGLSTQMYALSNPGALEQAHPVGTMPIPILGVVPQPLGPMDFDTYWRIFFNTYARSYCWSPADSDECTFWVQTIGGPGQHMNDEGEFWLKKLHLGAQNRCFGMAWYQKACCEFYACCIFCKMFCGGSCGRIHKESCDITQSCCREGDLGGVGPTLWCGDGPSIHDPYLWDYCVIMTCIDERS